jgi:hypothetical protein
MGSKQHSDGKIHSRKIGQYIVSRSRNTIYIVISNGCMTPAMFGKFLGVFVNGSVP